MKALLIIDIQNDFLPGGALAVPEGDQIIPLVNELMPEYDLVVATQDWHPEEHGSFATNHANVQAFDQIELNGLPQTLWPAHCVNGTDGARFAETLNIDFIDTIIQKGTDPGIDSYSGFYDNGHRKGTGLTQYLRKNEVTEVHLVGLTTDYCVKFTALDALKEGFKAVLIQDACRGVNIQKGDAQKAIAEMQIAGCEVTNTSDLLSDEVILYRPTGPNELKKLEEAHFKAWPQGYQNNLYFIPF